MMTIDELIRGIHDLGSYLKKFEEKYRLLSDDFYRLAIAGKLEQSNDFIEWLGIYEIKLSREQKYQQRIAGMLAQQKGELNLPLSESGVV